MKTALEFDLWDYAESLEVQVKSQANPETQRHPVTIWCDPEPDPYLLVDGHLFDPAVANGIKEYDLTGSSEERADASKRLAFHVQCVEIQARLRLQVLHNYSYKRQAYVLERLSYLSPEAQRKLTSNRLEMPLGESVPLRLRRLEGVSHEDISLAANLFMDYLPHWVVGKEVWARRMAETSGDLVAQWAGTRSSRYDDRTVHSAAICDLGDRLEVLLGPHDLVEGWLMTRVDSGRVD